VTKTNLLMVAESLSTGWKSVLVGRPGQAQLKILRMDEQNYPAEVHPFEEALLVIDGAMNLEVEGEIVRVEAGEVYLVAPGQPHAVAPGSHGTLVIIDSPQ
jgi:mannose-6-phosphate isomerase-like protein (cupin superfamily)